MSSPTDPVLVEQRGPIRWLTLNRPSRRNALDASLIAALDEQVTAADADRHTSVVAVTGAGPSFCAGADLRHLLDLDRAGTHPVAFLEDVSGCFTRIAAAATPWVAVLHGHAVAGGLELALACDLVVASDTTLIGDGHLRHGLLPAGGSSVRLPQAVGLGLARRLLLTGELLPASDFAASGWIDRIVPPDQLEGVAMEVCRALVTVAGPTQSALKGLLHRITGVEPAVALRAELDTFADNWTTQPVSTAVEAFLTARTTGGAA
ncbi:MAG TPA: enoyl-CoA hydratase [Propionibacteriaceae bacterium]|jgi:enoyl-CoA hydratase/carnithine racemase|uniref:Enoyl-CoA hydratase/isomerase family protein n=1 Tax=Candidatus Phosphoribacter hodrii TaxID=2953743 RepID=A0A934X4U7_9MICO|nr:enoyl-CoA hydratase/isomerase family protein [Candidatus Phosphoribacter hodrii]HBY24133.1 enoyl-CoA hydratase [Propionibacteriaceae bacterium]